MDALPINRRKRSPIYKMGSNEFKTLIETSPTFTAALKVFSLAPKGGNISTLKRRIHDEGIDASHIITGNNSLAGTTHNKNSQLPLDVVLVVNSSYSRTALKRRLIREGLLENKCQRCGLLPEWYEEILVLRLDHINGVSNDNRLENLRLMCPNCDSQLVTFSGRNSKRPSKPCPDCGGDKYRGSKRCKLCSGLVRRKVSK